MVEVETRSCDHGRHKNGTLNLWLSATLPTNKQKKATLDYQQNFYLYNRYLLRVLNILSWLVHSMWSVTKLTVSG